MKEVQELIAGRDAAEVFLSLYTRAKEVVPNSFAHAY